MSSDSRIAIVVPYFQREPGVLKRTVESAFRQTLAERLLVIVVDDESPVPADSELTDVSDFIRERTLVIRQENGGAGAARNRALDAIPDDVEFAAFLDSDDTWEPDHIENAVHALGLGFDFYFSDYIACDYRESSNFTRIGSLRPEEHDCLDAGRGLYGFRSTAIDHVVRQGNVIQTSTVVYRFRRFPRLRFREEFYNGQDFFFWMDIGELGARMVFSMRVECDCGEGINIYSGSGWGTDKFLRRVRNELKVWLSAARFYRLTPEQSAANRRKIAGLQETVIRDLLHRMARRSAIPWQLLGDIVRLSPQILPKAPWYFMKVFKEKLQNQGAQ